MARRRKKGSKKGKRYLPLISAAGTAKIWHDMGYSQALGEVQDGDFDLQALTSRLSVGFGDFTGDTARAAAIIVGGRRLVGKVPLISGKKYGICLF